MAIASTKLDVYGRKFTLRLDLDRAKMSHNNIGTSMSNRGVYEKDVSMALMKLLRPGDVFADVGGHVGYFSLLAAHLVGAAGSVVAFEPDADNRRDFEANQALNTEDTASVHLIPKPVADAVGTMTFHTNADNDGGHALWDPGLHGANPKSRENPESHEVEVTTLPATFSQLGIAPPRLIKIDTEGAETLVLGGAREWFEDGAVPYVACELNTFGLEKMGSSQEELRALMRGMGYETFYLDAEGNLPKWIPEGISLESAYILNIFFARPESLRDVWPQEVVKTPPP